MNYWGCEFDFWTYKAAAGERNENLNYNIWMAERGTTTSTSFQQALEVENGGALALSMKEEEVKEEEEANNNLIKERKVSWAKLGRVDALNLEAGRFTFFLIPHLH